MYEHKLSHPVYTMQYPVHHSFEMFKHHPYPLGHGFCHSCCHPIAKCCCGIRECRKEAKELMVSPESQSRENVTISTQTFDAIFNRINPTATKSDVTTNVRKIGTGEAFIGGGCCVHLSVEYMPMPIGGTESGGVLIQVRDSEETVLQWGKTIKPGSEYDIKEAIISTNPGAMLHVTVFNAAARVRWCECFSC